MFLRNMSPTVPVAFGLLAVDCGTTNGSARSSVSSGQAKIVEYGAALADWESVHTEVKQCGPQLPCAAHTVYALKSRNGRAERLARYATLEMQAGYGLGYTVTLRERGITARQAAREVAAELPAAAATAPAAPGSGKPLVAVPSLSD